MVFHFSGLSSLWKEEMEIKLWFVSALWILVKMLTTFTLTSTSVHCLKLQLQSTHSNWYIITKCGNETEKIKEEKKTDQPLSLQFSNLNINSIFLFLYIYSCVITPYYYCIYIYHFLQTWKAYLPSYSYINNIWLALHSIWEEGHHSMPSVSRKLFPEQCL